MSTGRPLLATLVFFLTLGRVASGGHGATALVATGDCRDPDLVANARLLDKQLEDRIGDRLLNGDALRAKIPWQPDQPIEAMAQQIEAAKALHYKAQFTEARDALRRALDELARHPPGPDAWKLKAQAELLYGLALRGTGQLEESDEAFRRILRLSPEAQLDPNIATPNARQRFERIRKELTVADRQAVGLEVKSLPSGAEIYLDGIRVGVTPQILSLHPGVYHLALVKDGLRSLSRPIDTREQTALMVDLELEGLIDLDVIPCLSIQGDERSRLNGALRLAALLDLEDVVVLRLERAPGGSSWLAASIVNTRTNQKLREGGLRIQTLAPVDGLAELTNYLVTGQIGPLMTTEQWRGRATIGLTAGGALASAAGVVLLLLGNASISATDQFYSDGHRPTPDEIPRLRSALDAGRLQQTLGVGSMAVGGAALLGGAALYFMSSSGIPSVVKVSATPTLATFEISW